MRSLNDSIRNAMVKAGALVVSLLVGMVLSTTPALASGENKMENDKQKVEMNKVEKDKVEKDRDEKVMIKEKKVEEKLDLLRINRLGIHHIKLLLDDDILGEED